MNLDYNGLSYEEVQIMSKAVCKAFKLFNHIVDEVISATKPYMKELLELIELLNDVEVIKKTNYKPVKEIKPNKVILLNKRFKRHYCRSNC